MRRRLSYWHSIGRVGDMRVHDNHVVCRRHVGVDLAERVEELFNFALGYSNLP